MKLVAGKTGKQRQTTSSKNKTVCGTISYIAECRGAVRKKDVSRWAAPPDGMSTIVRKYPAV